MTTKKKTSQTAPEITLINSLAEILNDTGLTEIEFEQKGVRVRVSRSVVTSFQSAPYAPAAAAPPPPSAMPLAPPPAAIASAPAKPSDHPGAVKSPMVGTAYLAATPGAAPFVSVGADVREGQAVLIIEAMKTMNTITAPRAGKVISIHVENGQPVEFGEALLVIA